MEPPTTIVPPFTAIAVRAPAEPSTTTSPPRIDGAVDEPELPWTTIRPPIMSAPSDQPASPSISMSRPSDSAAAEVADVSAEHDPRGLEDPDCEVVAGAGIENLDLRLAARDQRADLLVHLARRLAVGVDRRERQRVHARASPPASSYVRISVSSPNAPASAIPSETTATQSSVSATRQGLVEKRSRATPKPSAVETR